MDAYPAQELLVPVAQDAKCVHHVGNALGREVRPMADRAVASCAEEALVPVCEQSEGVDRVGEALSAELTQTR